MRGASAAFHRGQPECNSAKDFAGVNNNRRQGGNDVGNEEKATWLINCIIVIIMQLQLPIGCKLHFKAPQKKEKGGGRIRSHSAAASIKSN